MGSGFKFEKEEECQHTVKEGEFLNLTPSLGPSE